LTSKATPFLSPLQCRILIAIFFSKNEYLNSEAILKETGIAQSTWSEEQNRLTQMGLLEKRQSRIMTSNVITRVMNYKLTDKGRLVAMNLSNISRILAPDKFSLTTESEVSPTPAFAESIISDDQKEIDEKILECIEIGLDSFGMNLDELVKSEYEKSGELKWIQVSRHPERLVSLLNQLFGTGGSTSIESMIAANIRSRFNLRSIKSDRLQVLIAEVYLTKGMPTGKTEEKSAISLAF
jgi:DNA-binding MarR family transcriptional regulator